MKKNIMCDGVSRLLTVMDIKTQERNIYIVYICQISETFFVVKDSFIFLNF